MKQRAESLAVEFPLGWFIGLFLVFSLLSFSIIPLALAREAQPSKTANNQTQPVIQTTTNPVSEKAMKQALDSYSADDSLHFLLGSSPLSAGIAAKTSQPVMETEPPAGPAALHALQGTAFEKTEDVAMLVSEQCSQSGNASDGTSSCKRVYSNGHHATLLTQNTNEGDELKHQTVIEEFDGENNLLYRKTIRHRVDYNYLKDKKAKEKELFDIVFQPTGKKSTRELMTYEYYLDTGATRSLSWTQYQQIENQPKAELIYRAMLRYGDDGTPDRGVAEKWNHGEKTETFMNWGRRSEGFAALDEKSWWQWEGWIQNVSMQAYHL
jgi:hypothetical protein